MLMEELRESIASRYSEHCKKILYQANEQLINELLHPVHGS